MMNTNEKYLYRLFEKKLQESSNIVNERKQYMDLLRNYIKSNLDSNTFTFPNSTRHPNEEIIRIDVGRIDTDENAVENALKSIFGTPVKNGEKDIYTISYKDMEISFECNFELGQGPSGSYWAYKITFISNGILIQPVAFISDCTHRKNGKNKFGKKLFTPNAVLDPSLLTNKIDDNSYHSINEIIKKINYKKDELLTKLLKELAESAKSAESNNKEVVEYLTTPTKELSDKGIKAPNQSSIKITFEPTDELKELLKKIGSEKMKELTPSIYVDFGEIMGAIALAKVLGKEKKNIGIAYPSQSNYPLVDYLLKPLDGVQQFKVSAKAGAGGKPTLNAPCTFIMELVKNNSELQKTFKDTIDFIIWLKKCLGNNVHESFKEMSNYIVDLCEGAVDHNFLENIDNDNAQKITFYKNLQDQKKEILNIASMDKEITPPENLVKETNKVIEAIMGKDTKGVSFIQEKGIWDSGKISKLGDIASQYFDSLRIKCLTTILINIINNSSLMKNFNTLFNLSFGTFIQLYAKNITNTINENTIFEFEGVLKSIDGQSIGGQNVEYKLNFDCNIDSSSGLFKTKSLAMKLMHESKSEKYETKLKSLQEKYERISALKTIHEEIYNMCTSNKLEEENAQKYFTFLVNEGLKNIDFSLQGGQLDGELDHVNINRFNQQIKEPSIRKNYFEGKTLEQFKQSFYKFVNTNKDLDSKSKRQLRIVLNNYVDKFKNSNLKRYANWD